LALEILEFHVFDFIHLLKRNVPMKEPRVYKTSPALLVVIVILFLFFLGVLAFGFGFDSIGFLIPLIIFSLFLFGAIFVVLASKTIVSDEEITIQGLLGAKTLRWTEVARVSGKGYNLKLHNYDGDVTVTVSPRLPGYEEIVEFIGTKRSDLFNPMNYSEIDRGLGFFIPLVILVFVFAGFAVGLGMLALNSQDSLENLIAPLGVLLIFMFVIAWMFVSIPRSMMLEGNILTLKYLFNEKSIRADEINAIRLLFTQTRNGKRYFIALTLANRKVIRISGLGVGLPIAYLVLKNWHQANVRGQSLHNVAPNWSDNSWR